MVIGSFLFGVLVGSVPGALQAQPYASWRYEKQEKNVKEYLQEVRGWVRAVLDWGCWEGRGSGVGGRGFGVGGRGSGVGSQ
jgi:hypothetical protein